MVNASADITRSSNEEPGQLRTLYSQKADPANLSTLCFRFHLTSRMSKYSA